MSGVFDQKELDDLLALCDLCLKNKHCGTVCLPCMHYACEECKNKITINSVCTTCKTQNVYFIDEKELMKPGDPNKIKRVIQSIKGRHHHHVFKDFEYSSKMDELKKNFEIKREALNAEWEENNHMIVITSSALELAERIESKGYEPSEMLKNLKGSLVSMSDTYIWPGSIDFSKERIILGNDAVIPKRGLFNNPNGLDSNSKGVVFICDTSYNRIQVYGQGGEFIRCLGKYGSKPGELVFPSDIAIDNSDRVYVCDSGNNRVQVFNEDCSKLLMVFGKKGEGPGEFDWPEGICINPHNQEIIVSDHKNGRVQVFDNQGEFLRMIGSKGKKEGELDGPNGVAVNSTEEILVGESRNTRISVFDQNGVFVRTMGDDNPTDMISPLGICVDKEDNVYVGTSVVGMELKVFSRAGHLINRRMFGSNQAPGTPTHVAIHKVTGSPMVTDSTRGLIFFY